MGQYVRESGTVSVDYAVSVIVEEADIRRD